MYANIHVPVCFNLLVSLGEHTVTKLIPFKSGGGVGSANIRSRDTLALSPVCSVAHSLQHTLIEALNWASPLELCTFVPAGVSPCVNDDVEVSPSCKHTCDSRDSAKKSPHAWSAERQKLA